MIQENENGGMDSKALDLMQQQINKNKSTIKIIKANIT